MNTSTIENYGASPKAIQYHFDVGNDFYQLWLDKSLTYTCAFWEENEGDDSLELAQTRKLDFHIHQARASDANRVLDIGCGWGSLLRRMVQVHGVKQTIGLTLSQAQVDFIQSVACPQVQVMLMSWTHYMPEEPFDAILAVGVMEHAVKPELSDAQRLEAYRNFFSRCHAWLKPSGWISVQTIAYENMHRQELSQFICQVYPESDLPTLVEIIKASAGLFEVVALRNDRQHYERTCRVWLSRLKKNRAAVLNLVGEAVVAQFEKYLKLCIIGFHTRNMSLLRIAFHRID